MWSPLASASGFRIAPHSSRAVPSRPSRGAPAPPERAAVALLSGLLLSRKGRVARCSLGPLYDAETLENFFQERPLRVFGRLLKVLLSAVKCGLAVGTGPEAERRLARRVREAFTELGPSYIKLGQALSVRPDVLSEIFLQEFREFQDSVKPFEHQIAMDLVLKELGLGRLEELFSEFGTQPVAAASLGQVYKARLKNGTVVAVKVQRPELIEAVSLDLVLARQIAKSLSFFSYLLPEGLRGNDFVAFVDAFGVRLYEELDYETEVKNAERFRELYGDQEKLKVPTMFRSLATKKVIVMEWIDGVKLTDVSAIRRLGLEPLDFISVGIECAMRQLLEHGFFHADPHPGNFFVTKKGELCVLDFGMMSEMPKDARLAVIQHIVHVVNRDFSGMARDYSRLGFISEDIETAPMVAAIRSYFEPRMSKDAAEVSFKTIIDGLEEVIFPNYPFRVPAFYALVVRSLITLEGLALSIDPKYRVLEAAYPYLAKRVLLDMELRSSLQELLLNAQESKVRFRWDRAVDLLRESSKSKVAVPSARAPEGADVLDLALLIEDPAFRSTLVAELASTADVMIADIIGGAVGGDVVRKRLGLRVDDEARVSEVRETVNLIAEKVVDRMPSGMDAVGMAVQAAAGAVQEAIWREPGKGKAAEGPALPEVAGEFFDQLRERAAVRTLKTLANWIGEDEGDTPKSAKKATRPPG